MLLVLIFKKPRFGLLKKIYVLCVTFVTLSLLSSSWQMDSRVQRQPYGHGVFHKTPSHDGLWQAVSTALQPSVNLVLRNVTTGSDFSIANDRDLEEGDVDRNDQIVVAWATTEPLLAVFKGEMHNDNIIIVHFDEHGHPVETVAGDSPGCITISWSRDSSRLAAAGGDGVLSMWSVIFSENTNNNGSVAPLVNPISKITADEWITCVAWSPDGKMLASLCDGNYCAVRVWEVKDVQTENKYDPSPALAQLPFNEAFCDLLWLHDGRNLVISNRDHAQMIIWNWRDSYIYTQLEAHLAAQSIDGQHLVTYHLVKNEVVVRNTCTLHAVRRIYCNTGVKDLFTPAFERNNYFSFVNAHQVRLCDKTADFIFTVCEWTPRNHLSFSPAFRALVFLLMCVRDRLQKSNKDNTTPSLFIPLEMWLIVFEFLV